MQWFEWLPWYSFDIAYLKSIKNFASDLSWRSNCKNSISDVVVNTSLEEREELKKMKKFTLDDTYEQEHIAKLQKDLNFDTSWRYQNGQLTHHHPLQISDNHSLKLRLLQINRDSLLAGYFSETWPLHSLTCNYHWSNMCKFVKKYVILCSIFQRLKSSLYKPYWEFQSFLVLDKPWFGITLNFITDFPPSKIQKYNSVWVIIYKLTRIAFFIPRHKTVTNTKLATLFSKEIMCLYRLNESIVWDCRSIFIAEFWAILCYCFKMKQKLSTVFHSMINR